MTVTVVTPGLWAVAHPRPPYRSWRHLGTSSSEGTSVRGPLRGRRDVDLSPEAKPEIQTSTQQPALWPETPEDRDRGTKTKVGESSKNAKVRFMNGEHAEVLGRVALRKPPSPRQSPAGAPQAAGQPELQMILGDDDQALTLETLRAMLVEARSE
eukprot:343008-Prymnesium_polylepis.1